MAGRKKGFRHNDETRAKIQASQIINRLMKIGMGQTEATPAQVNALKTLLSKILPDLQSIDATVEHNGGERYVISAQPEQDAEEWLKSQRPH